MTTLVTNVGKPADIDGYPLNVGDFVYISDSDDFDYIGIIIKLKIEILSSDVSTGNVMVGWAARILTKNGKSNYGVPIFSLYGSERNFVSCDRVKKELGNTDRFLLAKSEVK